MIAKGTVAARGRAAVEADLAARLQTVLQALAVLGPAATVEELAAVLYAPVELIAATAGSAARTGMVLVDRVVVLYLSGQGRAAADLAAQRLSQVKDPRVAGGLVNARIRALINRADTAVLIAVIGGAIWFTGTYPDRVNRTADPTQA